MNTRETLTTLTSPVGEFSKKKLSLPMIQVEHCQLPASAEMPKHFSSKHFMTVHLNHETAVKELELNGYLQRGSFATGDICLTPAATPVSSVGIQEPSELIAIHIEPAFFVQTSAEIVDLKDLEFVPQFGLKDPLIHQMAIALKAQIESSEETWNRLYVETMVTGMCVHLMQRYSTQKNNAAMHSADLSSGGLPETTLGKVLEYIHEHADQHLSLLEMAQHVQMSPYHIR